MTIKKTISTGAFFLLGITLILASVSYSEVCRYRFYPTLNLMDVSSVTTPNSICIFPDGRSSLQDATSGSIEIVFFWLNWWNDFGNWTGVTFGGEGLFIPGNVQICGQETPNFFPADVSQLPAAFHTQPIFGGGHSQIDEDGNPSGECILYWAPSSCGAIPLKLFFNSPDINGDLVIGLGDFGLFSQDYYGEYNYRSDFDFDGIIGLSDLVVMSRAMGASCQ